MRPFTYLEVSLVASVRAEIAFHSLESVCFVSLVASDGSPSSSIALLIRLISLGISSVGSESLLYTFCFLTLDVASIWLESLLDSFSFCSLVAASPASASPLALGALGALDDLRRTVRIRTLDVTATPAASAPLSFSAFYGS